MFQYKTHRQAGLNVNRACVRLTLTVSSVALSLLPMAASAQTAVTADAGVASAFVWRGVNFTNRPVVQADLIVTQSIGQVALSAGGWINAEPADYSADSDLNMLPNGTRGPALTAITTWLDATVPLGKHSFTGGITNYAYPERTGFARDYNTTEVYARLAMQWPLSPRVQLWWDVDKVRGGYVEAALAQTFDAAVPIELGVAAGWSAGQETRSGHSSYFNRSGFAAVDGSISVPITRGRFTLRPSIHGVLANDDAARFVTPGKELRSGKIWWNLGGSWSY